MTTTQDLVTRAATKAGQRRTGVVLGVLEPDGTRVYAGAGRSAVPDEHALFEIGSISKVFTATVLADLVVQGRLELDQPLRDVLPPGTGVPTRDGTEITLRHLATHTSGLPKVPFLGFRPWVDYFRGRNPYATATPDVVLAHLATTKLRRRPGTGRMRYSNFGFGVLGLALIHATGAADYDALIATHVCEPLGLSRTGVHLSGVVQGHRGRGKPVERWHLTGIAGAGALVSTADDLLTFLAAQIEPAGTPLAEAIALTQAEQLGGRVGIGLGWLRTTKPRLLVWHNGGTGGFRSFAGFQPELRRGVVALTSHTRGVDMTALSLLRDLDRE